jgi:hypothetical protein
MTYSIVTSSWRGIVLLILSLITTLVVADQQTYEQIEWTQLMPEDDLSALLAPPDAILNMPDGGQQDNLQSLDSLGIDNQQAQRFQEALQSTRTIAKFDNKRISIPGFLVPIANNEAQQVSTFFIVPYFGACLHMPPPPPNQIIYGELTKGIEISSLYDPFWFDGLLIIDHTETALGASAYTMAVDNIRPYEE